VDSGDPHEQTATTGYPLSLWERERERERVRVRAGSSIQVIRP
jgi:hypothetical protein